MIRILVVGATIGLGKVNNIFFIWLDFDDTKYHDMGPFHPGREVGRCAFGIIFYYSDSSE